MIKRVICICISLIFCFYISACSQPEPENIVNDYSIFVTDNEEDYINFLNELNVSGLVGISINSYASRFFGPFTHYNVIYKICDYELENNEKYRYLLFKFETKQEYVKFLDEMKDDFELVDTSITSYHFEY